MHTDLIKLYNKWLECHDYDNLKPFVDKYIELYGLDKLKSFVKTSITFNPSDFIYQLESAVDGL